MSRLHSLRYAAAASGTAVLAVFPFAAATALVFRFPLPFSGYASGIDAVLPSLRAVAFYGVITGGFALVAVLGFVGGWLTGFLSDADLPGRRLRWSLAIGAGVAFGAVIVLAVLDKLIGPW